MTFRPDKLLNMPPVRSHHRFTARDTMLYALGVGATELDFVYEKELKALPTLATVLTGPENLIEQADAGIDPRLVLHAEQGLRVHQPLPIAGEVEIETRCEGIEDKGDKGSVLRFVRALSTGGEPLATLRIAAFVTGAGNWGGPRGLSAPPPEIPDRAPDHALTLPTLPIQALIYRLSGDYNPLHVDPAVAARLGLPSPILHGLCSYGIAARALLACRCDNDPTRLQRIDCRFAAPVYPGESLTTEIWDDGGGEVLFRTRVVERDVVVLDRGVACVVSG